MLTALPRIFSSSDADETAQALGSFYNDSSVTVEPVNRDRGILHELYAAPLGSITLDAMNSPYGMLAEAPCLERTFEFCVVTSGAVEVSVGKDTLRCRRSSGFVLSPHRRLRILGEEDFSVLNLKVPESLIEAQLVALAGCEISEPLEFATELQSNPETAGMWRLVRLIESELGQDPSLLSNRLVSERLCEAVLMTVLYSQPHNYSHLLQRERLPAEPRYIRRIEEYIVAHCERPIAARDLAAVAGVSTSTLYTGFKRHRGCTPIEFLKNTRLQRVRDALLIATTGTTVKEIATRWGFNHLGRFSHDYGRRYGETPSETLRCSARS